MNMMTRGVRDRTRRSLCVERAAKEYGEVVREGLARELEPVLRDATPAERRTVDPAPVMRAAGELLKRGRERLVAADVAYARSRIETRELRRRSVAAGAALYREVVALRRLVKGICGPESTEEYLGLVGNTPREPWQLLTWGQHLIPRLEAAGPPLPPGSDYSVGLTSGEPARPSIRESVAPGIVEQSVKVELVALRGGAKSPAEERRQMFKRRDKQTVVRSKIARRFSDRTAGRPKTAKRFCDRAASRGKIAEPMRKLARKWLTSVLQALGESRKVNSERRKL